MIAETAYNVIEALPEKEYNRLLQMLGLEKKPKKAKRKPVVTDAQAREYFTKKFNL